MFIPLFLILCGTFPNTPSSSRLTLFLPLRLNPYTDGFSWARKDGYERHLGIHHGEELTDGDDDGS